MNTLLQHLEEIIWPRGLKCLCCETLSEGELLCKDCAKALEAIRISAADAGSSHIQCIYRYDGVAKELVLLLKEEGMEAASKVLASGMAERVLAMNLPQDTLLTWVTMPEDRKRQRWIDHGMQLCEEVGRLTGMKVRQLLQRRGRLRTQRGLNREERLSNLKGSFVCCEALSSPVLIIDDVYTTGATVAACQAVLQAAGASRVYALTATQAISAYDNHDVKKG